MEKSTLENIPNKSEQRQIDSAYRQIARMCDTLDKLQVKMQIEDITTEES